MQKKLLAIFLFIIITTACLLSISVFAVGATSHNTKALFENTDYKEFSLISDLAFDEQTEDLYILQPHTPNTAAVLMKHEKGGREEILTLENDRPMLIYFANSKLYTLYRDGTLATDDLTLQTNEKNVIDFTVLGNFAYFMFSTSMVKIDLTTNIKEEIFELHNSPKNLALCGNDLYFIDMNNIYKYSTLHTSPPEVLIQNTYAEGLTASEKYLIYSDKTKLFQYDIASNTIISEMLPSALGGSGSIRDFSVLVATKDKLHIWDNLDKSIQRFAIQGSIAYDNFNLCSFGNDKGRFNSPTDIFEQSNKKYVLDNQNSRIQVIANEEIEIIDLPKGKSYNSMTINTEGEILVSTADEINILGKGIIKGYSDIRVLYTSFNGETYFASGNKLYLITSSGETLILTEQSQILSFAFDLENHYIFLAKENQLTRYDTTTKEKTHKDITGIVDIDIDFASTLYIVTSTKDLLTLDTNLENESVYSIADIEFKSNKTITPNSINALTIDKTNGQLLFCHTAEHMISYLPASILKAFTESDVPKLLPTVNILDGESAPDNMLVAQITGWPSTIIYPFHSDYLTHEVYPVGHTFTQITRLQNRFPEVLIIEEIDNYYYILYEKQTGFILKNKVTIKPNSPPPYSDGIVLHSKTNIYKMPITKLNADLSYSFVCDTLEKGESVTIINTVCDFKDFNGIVWYKISYGDKKIGYVSRSNITKKESMTLPTIKSGKIKAAISEGSVEIYDSMEANALSIAKLKDGTAVNILEMLDNDWLYIEGTDTTDNLVRGYVKNTYVTSNPLTTSQIVGICMITATILLLISALIVVKIFKTKNKKPIIMK